MSLTLVLLKEVSARASESSGQNWPSEKSLVSKNWTSLNTAALSLAGSSPWEVQPQCKCHSECHGVAAGSFVSCLSP